MVKAGGRAGHGVWTTSLGPHLWILLARIFSRQDRIVRSSPILLKIHFGMVFRKVIQQMIPLNIYSFVSTIVPLSL